jgi:hypothetical protein
VARGLAEALYLQVKVHCCEKSLKEKTMSRTILRAAAIIVAIRGLGPVAAQAEDAQRMTCSGAMIQPSGAGQTPKMVKLTLGPGRKIAVDVDDHTVNALMVSNNKVQLKFRTNDFEGEYFHYTGDLFFIYRSGHLMRLTCQKA